MKITHAQLFSLDKPFPFHNPARIYHHRPRATGAADATATAAADAAAPRFFLAVENNNTVHGPGVRTTTLRGKLLETGVR